MTATQARVNGQLGVRIHNGIVAGLVSFAVGLVLLCVPVLLTRSGRAGAGRLWSAIRTGRAPWWMLLGGACGALTVSTQGLVAGILGVALFTVGVVAGQTLHGLLLDRVGFGPAGVVAITPGRLLGGFFALAAVGVSLGGDVLARAPLWMLALPFLTGAGDRVPVRGERTAGSAHRVAARRDVHELPRRRPRPRRRCGRQHARRRCTRAAAVGVPG